MAALAPFLANGARPGCPLGGTVDAAEALWRSATPGGAFASGGARTVSPETANCSGCHDASIAPAARTHLGGSVGIDLSAGHPVDVPYPVLRAGYRPLADLDPRLVLDEGRVTCRTCHGGRDAGRHYLSMTDRDLCFACHRL